MSEEALRILLLSQWFDPEPGASKGLPLAKWLRAQGQEVKVLTGFPNYPGGKVYEGYRIRPWMREEMDGVPVLRVPLYPSHDAGAKGRIANYVSFALSAATIGAALTGPADVAYAYHPPPTVGLPSEVIKRTRGVPFLYHIADMWPDTVTESGMLGGPGGRIERIISAWCDRVYRQAAAITVLGPGFKELLVERGVPAEKIHVIYNWIDEEAFRPAERDPALAAELGLAGRFNVVYAGNLGPMQDLGTAIRAAALAAPRAPELQLVIVGTGHEEEALRSLAAEIGAPNVLFLGRRQFWEMSRINALADALLVHLRDRTFFHSTIPGKTQVALASGKPLLMGVAGDAADLVRWSGAGETCPPEDPQAMAEAMLRLAATPPERLDEMGAAGAAFYRERLSMEVGAARTLELLRQIARPRARRRG